MGVTKNHMDSIGDCGGPDSDVDYAPYILLITHIRSFLPFSSIHISGDECMTDDFAKILKRLVKVQQEQTEALILALREQMSAVGEKLAQIVENVTVIPSFKASQPS
ncbi:hypothetical protein RF11_06964 [Thelohanellus kitauei]|uniref:Uncharacterized protein n=1 Tax=Thelohanellus kitauei TaxID=669202 RepID=A0A0C2MC74_THEKT|nr:hypothetical protein RF11_06964 [Thelohanellus kitauei]